MSSNESIREALEGILKTDPWCGPDETDDERLDKLIYPERHQVKPVVLSPTLQALLDSDTSQS